MSKQIFFAESPEAVGIDAEKLEALFARVERDVNEGRLPAAQVALARDGRIAGMRTFGRVTHEGRAADATDDTLFCVFSSTKAIISAAGWQLIEQGKLDPSERVVDIIPEFGTNGKEVVTVDQLFTHRAGFPNAPYPQREWADSKARLSRFASWRLEWEPGSRLAYHPSSSMWVIAEIIERRSGLPYRDYVRRRIAEPLGLEDLWVGLPREHQKRMADIVHVGEPPTAEDYAALGFPEPPVTEVTEEAITNFNLPAVREGGVPGGGGVMTAAELALFYQALLNDGRLLDRPQILKAETVRMACEVRTGDMIDPMTGRRANRGLGVVIAGEPDPQWRGFGHTNSPTAFGHGGAGGQIGWADPETGISLGYATSGHDRNPMRLGGRGVGISSRAGDCRLADT